MTIKRIILAGIISMSATGITLAQEKVDLRENATAIIRQLAPIDFSGIKASIAGKSDPKLDLFAKALGLSPAKGDSLGLMQKSTIPRTNLTSYRFQQNYQGIPIWGESIVLTQQKDKQTRHIGGFAIKGTTLKTSSKPKISAEKALKLAKDLTTREAAFFDSETAHKVIYFDPDSGKSFLAWEVSFFVMLDNRPSEPVFLIDASTGKVLKKYQNLQPARGAGPGGNSKHGCYTYGKNRTPPLDIKNLGNGKCALISRNVTTRDCRETENRSNCKVPTFSCNYNKYKAIHNACSPLNDAHFFGNLVYDMYFAWYHTKALKQPLVLNVHYGKNMENAFWANKYEQMFFGDGANLFYPLVALDVTSHEVTHGFTAQHSGLIYTGQAGGINESFSDMAAEVAEAYFADRYMKPVPHSVPGSAPTIPPTSSIPPVPTVPRSMPRADHSATRTSQARTDTNSAEGINGILSGGSNGYGDQTGTTGGINSVLGGSGQNESGINGILSGNDQPDSNALQPTTQTALAPANNNLESGESEMPAYNGRTMFNRAMPDFEIGADIFREKGKALRYMDKPSRDGKSIDHVKDYKKGLDVHLSSGVFNRAFYLLAHKKNWGIRKAFEVFLTANAYYWTKNETFNSAAKKVVDAASDYRYDTNDVIDVFRQVGAL